MNIKDKNQKINIDNITPWEGHFFFGFYDITPWNSNENLLLTHRSNFIDRMPKKEDSLEVGFINLSNKKFIKIGDTKAWNFQQGARLQWLPGSKDRVIYNVRKSSNFTSRIHDIETKQKINISYPIYSISPKDKIAISLNFSRLQRLGGYGYPGITDDYKNNPAPKKDGLFIVDLEKNTRNLIISLHDVSNFKMESDTGSHHYVTHPTFNNSGDRFCFLHRFKLRDGGLYTRLLTANPDGSDMFLVAEGTLSHFDWFDNNRILIWGRSRSYLTKARKNKFFTLSIFKPILNLLRSKVRGFIRHKVIGDQYLIFEDKTGKSEPFAKSVLMEDGHPTRFEGTPWLITDTYPDKDHYRSLILYNIENNKRIDLAKLYSLPESNYINKYNDEGWDLSGMRSDLHPRWNRSGTKVCIDSVHEGKKSIYVLSVKEIIYESSKL